MSLGYTAGAMGPGPSSDLCATPYRGAVPLGGHYHHHHHLHYYGPGDGEKHLPSGNIMGATTSPYTAASRQESAHTLYSFTPDFGGQHIAPQGASALSRYGAGSGPANPFAANPGKSVGATVHRSNFSTPEIRCAEDHAPLPPSVAAGVGAHYVHPARFGVKPAAGSHGYYGDNAAVNAVPPHAAGTVRHPGVIHSTPVAMASESLTNFGMSWPASTAPAQYRHSTTIAIGNTSLASVENQSCNERPLGGPSDLSGSGSKKESPALFYARNPYDLQNSLTLLHLDGTASLNVSVGGPSRGLGSSATHQSVSPAHSAPCPSPLAYFDAQSGSNGRGSTQPQGLSTVTVGGYDESRRLAALPKPSPMQRHNDPYGYAKPQATPSNLGGSSAMSHASISPFNRVQPAGRLTVTSPLTLGASMAAAASSAYSDPAPGGGDAADDSATSTAVREACTHNRMVPSMGSSSSGPGSERHSDYHALVLQALIPRYVPQFHSPFIPPPPPPIEATTVVFWRSGNSHAVPLALAMQLKWFTHTLIKLSCYDYNIPSSQNYQNTDAGDIPRRGFAGVQPGFSPQSCPPHFSPQDFQAVCSKNSARTHLYTMRAWSRGSLIRTAGPGSAPRSATYGLPPPPRCLRNVVALMNPESALPLNASEGKELHHEFYKLFQLYRNPCGAPTAEPAAVAALNSHVPGAGAEERDERCPNWMLPASPVKGGEVTSTSLVVSPTGAEGPVNIPYFYDFCQDDDKQSVLEWATVCATSYRTFVVTRQSNELMRKKQKVRERPQWSRGISSATYAQANP